MQLSSLQKVFDHEGPAATVYLEGRSPTEDAAAQIRLRWRDLADQLRDQGADDAVITAIDDALGEGKYGWQQDVGRVLVAAAQGVLLDEALDAAQGAGDQAHWSPVPRLGRFLREQARTCRQVLVVTDQLAATVHQLVVSPELGSESMGSDTVKGQAIEQVHKPRGQGLSHRRIQTRAEEAAFSNAEDVVEHLRTVASTFRPAVVVLAGEVRARAAIREQLPPALRGLVVETEHGARAAGASDETLDDAVREIAERVVTQQGSEVLERLRDREHHAGADEGVALVAQAAQLAAVETLVFEHDAPVEGELWVGPEPEQLAVHPETLHNLGVSDPVRVDAESALIRCCAATGAGLQLVPAGSSLTDGVGALLRFEPGSL